MPYEEDFLQGYSEGCLTSLSPYVGGVYDKMSTDYQVYTQQTVSRVYKIQILNGNKNNVHCSSSFWGSCRSSSLAGEDFSVQ